MRLATELQQARDQAWASEQERKRLAAQLEAGKMCVSSLGAAWSAPSPASAASDHLLRTPGTQQGTLMTGQVISADATLRKELRVSRRAAEEAEAEIDALRSKLTPRKWRRASRLGSATRRCRG